MKTFLAIVVVLAIGLLVYFLFYHTPKVPSHDIEIFNEDGSEKKITIQKPTLICFFQSWCSDCVRETPLVTSFCAKNHIDLYYVSDEDWQKIHSFTNRFDSNIPAFHTKKALSEYGIKRYPTIFVYNAKGELVQTIIESVDETKLESLLTLF